MKTTLMLLLCLVFCAIIGAVTGLLTGDFRLDSALGGALVGLFVGSWLSLRIYAHRNARPPKRLPADETDASSRSVTQLGVHDFVNHGRIHQDIGGSGN